MPLTQELATFTPRLSVLPGGRISWRSAGDAAAPTLVLLHGIGSASGSWVRQLGAAQRRELGWHMLAWDAPGYGNSDRLPQGKPAASDYANRLWEWLDSVIHGPVTLVGHSLGALMAGAACRLRPTQVTGMILLSPALGHARAPATVREGKLNDRLQALNDHGPGGLAQRRAAAMLSPQATPEQVEFIRDVMAQIDPQGYTQAAQMLAAGDLEADLLAAGRPCRVASGSMDTITPPSACEGLARAVGADYVSLGPVGHACPVEAADAVNALLDPGRAAVSGGNR